MLPMSARIWVLRLYIGQGEERDSGSRIGPPGPVTATPPPGAPPGGGDPLQVVGTSPRADPPVTKKGWW